MKVKKYDLVRVVDKLKSVVQKNEAHPSLNGILVSGGYLIAANTEITMQVKLEGTEMDSFIIPAKAFDLIKNLPDGEVQISEKDKHMVTIQMKKIKNVYQSFPPEDFIYKKINELEDDGLLLPGNNLMEALSHVAYAADEKNNNKIMSGIYFDGEENRMNIVALDGHVIAWDTIKATGTTNVKLIVPKVAVKHILAMGIMDDVNLTYDKNSAVFKTDEYTIYTRLIEGEYFKYNKMFSDAPISTVIGRRELSGAMTRAKMCTDEKSPTVFDINGSELKVVVNDKVTDYSEVVPLQVDIEKPLTIGFDSRLVLGTVKAFTCDNLRLNFSSPEMPMVVEAEDSDMKAIVLPIKLR